MPAVIINTSNNFRQFYKANFIVYKKINILNKKKINIKGICQLNMALTLTL